MDRKRALGVIEEIARDVIGDDDLNLTEGLSAESVEGWDSLAHINIVIGIEERYGCQFKSSDLASLRRPGSTIGKIVDLVVGLT